MGRTEHYEWNTPAEWLRAVLIKTSDARNNFLDGTVNPARIEISSILFILTNTSMSDQDQSTNNETPQEKTSKTERKFLTAISNLTAILSGEENLNPVKRVASDDVGRLVDELFKDERKAVFEKTKTDLKSLLQKYHELQKAVKEKQAELDKMVLSKKEEFVKAAQALFAQIQGLDGIRESYEQGLKAATQPDGPNQGSGS